MRVLFLKSTKNVEMRNGECYSFPKTTNFARLGSEITARFLKGFVEFQNIKIEKINTLHNFKHKLNKYIDNQTKIPPLNSSSEGKISLAARIFDFGQISLLGLVRMEIFFRWQSYRLISVHYKHFSFRIKFEELFECLCARQIRVSVNLFLR